MPFDGLVLKAVEGELKEKILNGRIDKIYQPEKDSLLFVIRSNNRNFKLYITANPSFPRLHLTDFEKENPKTPPPFCMLLRKHLTSGKIIEIKQEGLDRILKLDIETYDEIGDLSIKTLIIEIMGKHSNVILITNEGIIIDAIKRVGSEINRYREILPGIPYVPPPQPDKSSLLELDASLMEKIRNSKQKISKCIMENLMGISPIIAEEICTRANIDSSKPGEKLSKEEFERLYMVLKELSNTLKDKKFYPNIIKDQNGNFVDFSCIDITLYEGLEKETFKEINKTIDVYYHRKEELNRISQIKSDLKKVINSSIEKISKKLEAQVEEFNSVLEYEKYRLYGDLILMNMHLISNGDEFLECINYEDNKVIKLPLDKNLSPAQNAQKYYKLYQKSKNTFLNLEAQIEKNKEELNYLEEVLNSIEISENQEELEEIREELVRQGYLKEKNLQKIKTSKSMPHVFTSSDGFEIYVGKNNTQNDFLTLKMASDDDIWLHTKNIPGSHVIIKTNKKRVPESTLMEASILAAFFSKAKNSSNIPVDYTFKKFVKKPKGTKPGMVIYHNYKTIYVTPSKDNVDKIMNNKKRD